MYVHVAGDVLTDCVSDSYDEEASTISLVFVIEFGTDLAFVFIFFIPLNPLYVLGVRGVYVPYWGSRNRMDGRRHSEERTAMVKATTTYDSAAATTTPPHLFGVCVPSSDAFCAEPHPHLACVHIIRPAMCYTLFSCPLM